jgi:predicted P-loop ATPase
MDLHGPWIVEWSELAGLGRTEIESVKALVSRRVDRLRLPYARTTVDLPRRCVMAATTNEEGWATDQSGNRRYWPVPVAACDPHALATARDQLWAEARDALTTANEAWWLSRTETALAAREQAARLPDDPWLDTVDAALSSGRLSRRSSVTQDDIADVLDIDLERRHPGTARRIASVMRAIGWPSYRRREDGARCRGWTRPSSPPKAGPDDRQTHLGQDTTHPGQHDDPVPDGPDDPWGGPDA